MSPVQPGKGVRYLPAMIHAKNGEGMSVQRIIKQALTQLEDASNPYKEDSESYQKWEDRTLVSIDDLKELAALEFRYLEPLP